MWLEYITQAIFSNVLRDIFFHPLPQSVGVSDRCHSELADMPTDLPGTLSENKQPRLPHDHTVSALHHHLTETIISPYLTYKSNKTETQQKILPNGEHYRES